MSLLVQKFGGTSVGSPERIRSVAKKIAKIRSQGHELVVVVSAMGHTTDELLQLAQSVSREPPHREVDMLLTAGERISMALLCMALADQGVPALSLTGSQSGIITDCRHRRARILRIMGGRIKQALNENKVAIVAGFQGVSEQKDVTTLGRGGSDTTAIALAAALGAERCDIYTDVDGMFSADPRLVPESKPWSFLPYDLALEMALRGASVLHPRSVEIAKKYQLKVRLLNSLKDTSESGGTWIMNHELLKAEGMEQFRFAGVTADPAKMGLSIVLARTGTLAAVCDAATHRGLTVTTPVIQDGRVWFFADRSSASEWKKALDALSIQEFVKSYEIREDLAPVSLIGDCFSQDGMVFQKIIDVLGTESIAVEWAMGSGLAFTGAIASRRVEDAVRALHEAFMGPGSDSTH